MEDNTPESLVAEKRASFVSWLRKRHGAKCEHLNRFQRPDHTWVDYSPESWAREFRHEDIIDSSRHLIRLFSSTDTVRHTLAVRQTRLPFGRHQSSGSPKQWESVARAVAAFDRVCGQRLRHVRRARGYFVDADNANINTCVEYCERLSAAQMLQHMRTEPQVLAGVTDAEKRLFVGSVLHMVLYGIGELRALDLHHVDLRASKVHFRLDYTACVDPYSQRRGSTSMGCATLAGCVLHLAPEQLDSKSSAIGLFEPCADWTDRVTVWSAALLTLSLFIGAHPIPALRSPASHQSVVAIAHEVLNADWTRLIDDSVVGADPDAVELRALLKRCLCTRPALRASLDEVRRAAFVQRFANMSAAERRVHVARVLDRFPFDEEVNSCVCAQCTADRLRDSRNE